MPTTAPLIKVASVPEMSERMARPTISCRRSGAMAVMPPIIMPALPKLAKPQSA